MNQIIDAKTHLANYSDLNCAAEVFADSESLAVELEVRSERMGAANACIMRDAADHIRGLHALMLQAVARATGPESDGQKMAVPTNSTSPTARHGFKSWWFAILQGLAGAHPSAGWGADKDRAHKEREAMKQAAGDGLAANAEPRGAAFRAPWWLLWSYAHWWRACDALDSMPAEDYDQAFERGMDFRRYLGAWLWSVGVPQLGMTPADLEAVHQLTGVAPLPHPLLPIKCSLFLLDCFQTTKVDSVPARDLNVDTVLKAFADSEVTG